MLIRISLIIAILAALAVGGLNFVKVKEKITTLKDQRDAEQKAKVEAQTELASTKDTLDKTSKKLKQTEETLTATTTERDTAKAEAETQTKKAVELQDKLTKTTEERDDARANLAAYRATGFTPDQISGLGNQIKQGQEALEVAIEEKKILSRNIARLANRLKIYEGDQTPITMRGDLKGKIVVADPKWDFVVLDIGEEQGVLENGELLVSRGGKLVGKIIVRSVQKDRSIANVVPGWKQTDLMEGDVVIAAYPAS